MPNIERFRYQNCPFIISWKDLTVNVQRLRCIFERIYFVLLCDIWIVFSVFLQFIWPIHRCDIIFNPYLGLVEIQMPTRRLSTVKIIMFIRPKLNFIFGWKSHASRIEVYTPWVSDDVLDSHFVFYLDKFLLNLVFL